MIDVTRTLGPAGGIARVFGLQPPTPRDPLWTAGVELRSPGPDDNSLPLSARMVGACGLARNDALVRGAGEAVERFALHPGRAAGPVRGRRTGLPAPAVEFHRPEVALGAPHAADLELHWYPARRLRDGAKVMVPAPLVDWPCDPRESAYFDPGPSGAASGLGREMALRAALLEVVERDAVMVAWQRGLRAYRVADPAALAAPGGDGERSRRALGELWQRARREGMTPFLVVLPTAHPAVWCCVGGLDDADGDLAAIGCKASDRPWEAALGAFQEAWQVRSVLLRARESGVRPVAAEEIVDEDDRIAYLASPAGAAAVREWLAGCDGDAAQVAWTPGVGTEELVAAVLADGGDPLVVDLAARLPEPLRAMGWHALKVVPVGYQQLRMDERHTWSWNRARLVSAVERTGLAARRTADDDAPPHPLP